MQKDQVIPLAQLPDCVGRGSLRSVKICFQGRWIRLVVCFGFFRRQTTRDKQRIDIFLHATQNIGADPIADGNYTRVRWRIG